MNKYICEKCNIQVNSSTCPSCGERTKSSSKIFWCPNCKIPTWGEKCNICEGKTNYLATDIRPVFPEERLLLEILIKKPLSLLKKSVWHGSNSYFSDGIKVKIEDKNLDIEKIRNEVREYSKDNDPTYFKKYIETWLKENKPHFNDIETEAIESIKKIARGYATDSSFISFSGGKDSTVTSHLVTKALGTKSVLHIFGNTTLEFEETINYINRFKKNQCRTPVITAINKERNFFDLCEIVGPPSRVKRWCCTTFKTGPITTKIEQIFKSKKILTYYGIRRCESRTRSKYDQLTESPKISKQMVFSPIIDWLDYDVWLYILENNLDFNKTYRLGFTRVGCWVCPNNSKWSELLIKINFPEMYEKWHKTLLDFAIKTQKTEPEKYVDNGSWKARQGGNGLGISKNFSIRFSTCISESNTFNYELTKSISPQLYEFFKPFGKLNFNLGNPRLQEIIILDVSDNPIISLSGRSGTRFLKVRILRQLNSKIKNINEIESMIRCQISKYQICIGCMACIGTCKSDAITIQAQIKDNSNITYKIDEEKCIHCLKCIRHFSGGCYMRDVIRSSNKDFLNNETK